MAQERGGVFPGRRWVQQAWEEASRHGSIGHRTAGGVFLRKTKQRANIGTTDDKCQAVWKTKQKGILQHI